MRNTHPPAPRWPAHRLRPTPRPRVALRRSSGRRWQQAPGGNNAGIPAEPIGLGHVHPSEQLRVVGLVRHAVGSVAANLRVDLAHARNQLFGFRGWRVGGAGDEVGGAPQPPDQIGAEVGMVVDPGQRPRMQQLQHQCAQAAGQHARKFGVDAPGDAVGPEDAGIAQRLIVFDGALTTRKRVEHPAMDLFGGGGSESAQDG